MYSLVSFKNKQIFTRTYKNMQKQIQSLINRSVKAQTQLWFDQRNKNLSGTDMGIIIGANSSVNCQDLIERKKNNFSISDNKYLRHGRKYEPVAIELLEKKLDVNIQEIGYITSEDYENFGATPDGITIYNNEIVLVEIKCPLSRKISGIISLAYYAQIQMQLLSTNLKTCLFYECEFEEMDKNTYNFYSGEKGFNESVNEYWKLKNQNLMVIKRDQTFLDKYLPKMRVFYRNMNSRKRKLAEIDDVKEYVPYITKSYLKDYSNNNKFDSWLKMHGRKHYPEYISESVFTDEINKKINLFKKQFIEKLVVECQQNNLLYTVIPHSTFYHEYQEIMTAEHMKRKYDVIINPVLSYENYVSNPTCLISKEAMKKLFGINTSNQYHVFNKVGKNLQFKANNEDLSSDKKHTQYKLRNLFDSFVLYKKMNVMSESFLVGNKSYYKKNKETVYNDDIKVVKFSFDNDDYNKIIPDYTKWVTEIKSKKNDKYCYKTDESYRPFLESNDTSGYAELKKYIIRQTNDVQMMYSVGSSVAQKLYNKYSIKEWNDKLFLNGDILNDVGISSVNQSIIKEIFQYNNGNNKELLYSPNKGNFNNQEGWMKKNKLELYIDFETINDFLGPVNMIYMVGMWIVYPNGSTEFKCYFAKTLDHSGEKDIVVQWLKDIKSMERKYSTTAKCFCWSDAENTFIKQFNKTHNMNVNVEFIDLLKILKRETILVKDNLEGFSLKSYVKYMNHHGLIKRNYKVDCNSGDKSIISAIKYYEDNDRKEYNDLIKYNEIDCAVMHELLVSIRGYFN